MPFYIFSCRFLSRCLRAFLLAVALLLSADTSATHIVGGEMNYEYLGNSKYRIRLTVYRDCYNGVPDFDSPAYIGLFDTSDVLIRTVAANYTSKSFIPNVLSDPCRGISNPTTICYEVTTYDTVLTIPSIPPGGIQVVYQRCCRNNSILNIINPGSTGETFWALIPDDPFADSNPVFKNLAPTFICAGYPLTLDLSATDKDDDSIVYRLTPPLEGATSTSPQPSVPVPPFDASVVWTSPYSMNNMLGGTPALAIDPVTGILTANPATSGQFVIAVVAEEYRNGVRIGETRREFQVNVTPCYDKIVSSLLVPSINCGDLNAVFTNQSSGATFYHWDFGIAAATNDTSDAFNPSFVFPDTGTYMVKLIAYDTIDNKLCMDSSFAAVNVYPKLDPGFDYSLPVCVGAVTFTDTTSLIRTFPNSFSWDFGDNTGSAVHNPVHVYTKPGNYTVKLEVTSAAGCVDSVFKQIYVSINPQVDAGPDKLICTGSSIIIGSAPDSLVNYSWSPALTLSDPTVYNPVASPTAATTYTLVVTDKISGCRNTDSLYVAVSLPLGDAGPDDTLCAGVSRPIGTPGIPRYTYSWTPSSGLSNAAVADPVASLLGNATYYLLITDSNGCTRQDSVHLAVITPPVPDAGDSVRMCSGDTVAIGSNASPSLTYSWSPAGGLSNTAISNPLAYPNATRWYLLTATEATGHCSGKDSVFIDVVSVPADAGPPVSLCKGDSVQLGTPGTPGYNYSWSPPAGLSSGGVPQPWAHPLFSTTYVLKVNDLQLGCEVSDTVQVIVNTMKPVSAGPDIQLCTGDSVVLGAGNDTSYTYTWFPASGLNNASLANPTALPGSSVTYTVTVSDPQTGCSAADQMTLALLPLPVAVAGSNAVICSGDTLLLGGPGNSSNTYSWSPSVRLIQPDSSSSGAYPLANTTYVLKVTDRLTGCSARSSVTVEVALTQLNIPNTVRLCRFDSVQLNPAGNPAYTYSWSPSTGLSSASAPNPVATPTGSTTYTVLASQVNSAGITCTATQKVLVDVSADTLSLSIPPSAMFCETQPLLLVASPKGSTGTLIWSSAPDFSDTLNTGNDSSIYIRPLVSRTYYVKLYDGYCEKTDSIALVKDSVAVTVPPATVCKGNQAVLSVVNNSGEALRYFWQPGNLISGSDTAASILVNPVRTSTFSVIATNSRNCSHVEEVEVTVQELQNPDLSAYPLSIFPGESSTLYAPSPVKGYVYQWIPSLPPGSSSFNPVVSPTATTVYRLVATDTLLQCSAADSVEILVRNAVCGETEVFIPNSFTPNGDGKNDVLYVRGNYIRELSLIIYNRWGEKMTEINSQSAGWDGTYKGKPLDPGVFVYYLVAKCMDIDEPYVKKGNITLIR
jgi:gliding motility-associated-like protein